MKYLDLTSPEIVHIEKSQQSADMFEQLSTNRRSTSSQPPNLAPLGPGSANYSSPQMSPSVRSKSPLPLSAVSEPTRSRAELRLACEQMRISIWGPVVEPDEVGIANRSRACGTHSWRGSTRRSATLAVARSQLGSGQTRLYVPPSLNED